MKMNRNRILSLLLALVLLCTGAFTLFQPDRVKADMPSAQDFKTLEVGMGGQQVRSMQQALQALGFYEGQLHGNFSRAFEGAVKDFQEYMGIPVTGDIDFDLYALLYDELENLPETTQAPRPTPTPSPRHSAATPDPLDVQEDGYYTDKDRVAAYLKKYGKLPENYITKQEARKLGWTGSRSTLWDVAWGMSIGGDTFGNYEEILPIKRGRQYYECDIDFDGGRANAKRIVYSNDGLIFYTEDHYETFEEIR